MFISHYPKVIEKKKEIAQNNEKGEISFFSAFLLYHTRIKGVNSLIYIKKV